MKILMSSHVFYPNIGGLEKVSEILAAEFVRAGHELVLITQTLADHEQEKQFIFSVVRNPNVFKLLKLIQWSDVFFHNNISLQTLWPLLFYRRPWVVAHHIRIPRDWSIIGLKGKFKHWILRWAECVSISHEIAADFSVHSVVIPDPYDKEEFSILPNISRDKELIFVGRLVSSKGVDLLFDALRILHSKGLFPQVTIVGNGPDLPNLKKLMISYHLEGQVEFAGIKRSKALVNTLNQHQILVAPSRWEAFGIVALEGMACGCVIVGSSCGGLTEAIGSAGVTFPNRDVDALAHCLRQFLTEPKKMKPYRLAARAHLKQHSPHIVAARYLAVFKNYIHDRA